MQARSTEHFSVTKKYTAKISPYWLTSWATSLFYDKLQLFHTKFLKDELIVNKKTNKLVKKDGFPTQCMQSNKLFPNDLSRHSFVNELSIKINKGCIYISSAHYCMCVVSTQLEKNINSISSPEL